MRTQSPCYGERHCINPFRQPEKTTTVIASIATQCVRNLLATENGTAQTFSGSLKKKKKQPSLRAVIYHGVAISLLRRTALHKPFQAGQIKVSSATRELKSR
ncbi:MAG: hypothetical protein IJV35_07435 [Neisseriaceae bacterium]|nr:hypothetical protein [Neisseriaceae bacterium]